MLRKTKDYFFANNNSNFKYFFIGMLGAFGFAPFNLYPIFIAVFSWFLANAYDNSLVSLQKSFFFFLDFTSLLYIGLQFHLL